MIDLIVHSALIATTPEYIPGFVVFVVGWAFATRRFLEAV